LEPERAAPGCRDGASNEWRYLIGFRDEANRIFRFPQKNLGSTTTAFLEKALTLPNKSDKPN